MKENFLRQPATFLEYVADGLRILGFLSVFVAAIWWLPTDAAIVAFTLPGLVAPRFVGVRAGFDIVFQLTLLAAAWSNVADLYRTLAGWDSVVHVVCTAVLSPMVYLLLARWSVVPAQRAREFRKRTAIVLSTTIGLAISALWEMVEWVGFVLITDEIFVEYHDTIGDMAAGGFGALAAGFVLATVRLERPIPAKGSPDNSDASDPSNPTISTAKPGGQAQS